MQVSRVYSWKGMMFVSCVHGWGVCSADWSLRSQDESQDEGGKAKFPKDAAS